MDYQDINAKTIDRWVREGWEWGRPIDHETYLAARAGRWDVLLTPTKPVPHAWFGDLAGKKVLGLASGGGQQMPIFAALGARCTVLDYSEEQLNSERLVARREGYDMEIVRGDMTKPLPFPDGSFDLIFHFVNYLVDESETAIVNQLPFDPVANEDQRRQLEQTDSGMQFSHTLEEQINGQLEAGFTLLALYEDTNGEGRLHELNVPTFLAMLSRKDGPRQALE